MIRILHFDVEVMVVLGVGEDVEGRLVQFRQPIVHLFLELERKRPVFTNLSDFPTSALNTGEVS